MAQTSNLVQINSISAQDMTGYNNQQTLRANYYIDWGISDRISIQDFHWTVSYKGSDNVTRNLYNQTGPESGALAVAILTNSIAPNVTNAKSVKINISVYCEFTYTYSGVIQYLTSETATKDVTLTFPESYMKPTGSFSLSPVNTSTISGLSGYVSGFCKIKATRNVSLQYNATVKSWTVKIGSAAAASVATSATSYESAVQNAVTSATNVSVVCTLTDSRGYSISQTLTAALIPYHNPSVVAANTSAYRSTNAGVAADDGTYCTIKLKSLIARCVYNNTTQNDSVTIPYRYKSKAGSWSSYANVTGASNTDSGAERTYPHTGFVFGNGAIATNTSYDVELKITDKFGKSVATTFTIPTETWAFHIISGGNGAAIGKAAENANQMQIPDGWRYYRGAHKVWDAGDITPVSKTGDTITGHLTVKNKFLYVQDTDITSGVNPSSNIYGDGFYLSDSAGTYFAYVRPVFLTDGRQGIQLETRRSINGSWVYNTLNVTINGSGTRLVQVSDGAAWRSAIGAASQADIQTKMSLTSHTISNISVPANGTANATVNISKDGYYPYGIGGWHLSGTGSSYAWPVWLYLSARGNGTATINYCLRSVAGNAHTHTFYVDVIWVKMT